MDDEVADTFALGQDTNKLLLERYNRMCVCVCLGMTRGLTRGKHLYVTSNKQFDHARDTGKKSPAYCMQQGTRYKGCNRTFWTYDWSTTSPATLLCPERGKRHVLTEEERKRERCNVRGRMLFKDDERRSSSIIFVKL
jgi:hypothetical protein